MVPEMGGVERVSRGGYQSPGTEWPPLEAQTGLEPEMDRGFPLTVGRFGPRNQKRKLETSELGWGQEGQERVGNAARITPVSKKSRGNPKHLQKVKKHFRPL